MDIDLLSELISERIQRATMPADTQGIALDVHAILLEHDEDISIHVVTQLVAYSIRINVIALRKDNSHDYTQLSADTAPSED